MGEVIMRPSTTSIFIFTAAVGFFILMAQAEAVEPVQEALAIIQPVAGEKVSGEIHIMPSEDGLKITGKFQDLESGSHGFHVHRFGNCTAPNEGSVGPHFAPIAGTNKYHGDLPHVEADMNGKSQYEAVVNNLGLAGEYSIVGRAMVIHAKDGKKIGCGVIGISK
jgi:Cu-Zn family superoxide dismutase